jgi:hypothetical protein
LFFPTAEVDNNVMVVDEDPYIRAFKSKKKYKRNDEDEDEQEEEEKKKQIRMKIPKIIMDDATIAQIQGGCPNYYNKEKLFVGYV